MACGSTGDCFAIVVTCSKPSGAGKHPGVARLLNYENRSNAGTYAEALRQAGISGGAPDVTATRRKGALKYGFGVNAEQEITGEIGVFAKLGWNNGKTESFAFTAIDRLATAGLSINGKRWHRAFDTVATELTASGISGVHALYLCKRRLRFSDRRWPPAVWTRIHLGDLLQCACVPGRFCKF
jgi:carbohydrate-selective porin OprB